MIAVTNYHKLAGLTTGIDSLTVLGARGLTLRCRQGPTPPADSKGESVPSLGQPPAAPDVPWPVAASRQSLPPRSPCLLPFVCPLLCGCVLQGCMRLHLRPNLNSPGQAPPLKVLTSFALEGHIPRFQESLRGHIFLKTAIKPTTVC